jgi:hypothetical protein
MNFIMAIFLSLIVSLSLWANKKDFGLPAADLRPGQVVDGQIFSVKIVPGDKETSFYIVGNKMAQFNLDQLKLELFINNRTVVLTKKKDAFITTDKLLSDAELKIKTPDGKIDQLRLKLNP